MSNKKSAAKTEEITIPLSTHMEQMLISAVRYALGRRTYIVDVTTSYVGHLLPKLSDWTLGIMLRDLEDEYAMAARVTSYSVLGDPCDVADWDKFKAAVKAETDRRTDGTAQA